jgi:hypothetical protein
MVKTGALLLFRYVHSRVRGASIYNVTATIQEMVMCVWGGGGLATETQSFFCGQ